MGMAAPTYYSAEMVLALPDDGNKYETVRGELLVTPAPRPWHEIVERRLSLLLETYAQEHELGVVFTSRADISWGPDILVQPDIFVVPLEEARTLDWSRMRSLRLVAEVLSPSTARHDRFTKRRLYQEVGVPTYWVVDPDQHTVDVWTPRDRFPTIEKERIIWNPAGAREPLTVELDTLFRPL